MNEFLETLKYTIPSLISGLIAVYYFKEYTKSDVGHQKMQLLREGKKHTTTLKLQAYERMTMFLERITPSNLIFRVKVQNENKQAYEMSLIHTIEKEFEHNITQQIYISDECWNVISTSKDSTIQLIIDVAKDTTITNSDQLREAILNKVMKKQTPSDTALAVIKKEVRRIL